MRFRIPGTWWLVLIALRACAAVPPDPPGWQVLFREDFEGASTVGWLQWAAEAGAAGWSVEKEGANHVFSGQGHSFAILAARHWYDFRFRVRVKPFQGTLHLNYRYGQAARYFVGFTLDSIYLARTKDGVHTNVRQVPDPHTAGTWYHVEIVGVGPNLKIYIDGVLKIDFVDATPVLSGSVGFETLEASHFHVDDMEVSGPGPTGPTWVRTGGPRGGTGYDIRMRPDNPDILYVTDNSSGIAVSTDGGRSWRPSNSGIVNRAGPSSDAIPVFCLTIDPNNPDTIWVGTQNTRGIYKSTDAGKTWVRKNGGVVEDNGISFRGITVDPRDSSTVYAAAEISSPVWAGQQRFGREFDLVKGVVYKTTDGGENWRAVWRGDNLARYIWIDPRDSNVLYVSTGIFDREAANSDPLRGLPGGVGILKSMDGGRSWKVLNQMNGLLNLYVGSLFMHPRNPDVLLAGTGHSLYYQWQGVYLSTDGGETWRRTLGGEAPDKANGPEIGSVEFATSDPDIAYAGSVWVMYRSQDGGRSWKAVRGSGTEPLWGPPGVFNGFPIDFQVDPRKPERLLVNDYQGGNFLSEDGGHNWMDASSGYTGVTLNDVAVDPSDHQRVYVLGRSGVYRSDDGGNRWFGLSFIPANITEWFPHPQPFADWDAIAVHPTDPRRVIAADQYYASILLSSDFGRDWRMVFRHPGVSGGHDDRQGFRALAFAPSNPQTVYAGLSLAQGYLDKGSTNPSFGIWKSTDGGLTWREANDSRTARLNVTALAVDRRTEDVVYAASWGNGVFRTTDGGRSWERLNTGLGSLRLRSIAIDPGDWKVLYVGAEDGGLHKSTNAGASWQFSNVGMDPNASVRDIVIDPTNSRIVYAADVRTGVYRSENAGELWTPVTGGLSNRAVVALTLSADGGTLYAATDGGGVFRLDLQQSTEGMLAGVSAASFARDAALAPESIASLFGAGLAAATQQATSTPLPVMLGEASVSITDSAGVDRWAPLFFASPGQINCLIPAGTAPGAATVRVLRQNRVVARGQVTIEPVAPALFTANADGRGAPAAVGLRIAADGSQTQLPVFNCGATCTPAPIDLGAETDQVILLLFGTGIRGGKSVSVRIGGVEAPVLGAAAQGEFVGLDQVNVRLLRALAGRGEVDVVLTVDGKAANTVKIRVVFP